MEEARTLISSAMDSKTFNWGSKIALVAGLLGLSGADFGTASSLIDAIGAQLLVALGAGGGMVSGIVQRLRRRSEQIGEIHSAVLALSSALYGVGSFPGAIDERFTEQAEHTSACKNEISEEIGRFVDALVKVSEKESN